MKKLLLILSLIVCYNYIHAEVAFRGVKINQSFQGAINDLQKIAIFDREESNDIGCRWRYYKSSFAGSGVEIAAICLDNGFTLTMLEIKMPFQGSAEEVIKEKIDYIVESYVSKYGDYHVHDLLNNEDMYVWFQIEGVNISIYSYNNSIIIKYENINALNINLDDI